MQVKIIRDQQGFIAVQLLSIFIVGILIIFSILMATAFGMRKQAVMTYDWFGESMNFAAAAANMDGDISQVTLSASDAKNQFIEAFSKITETTYANGKFNPVGNSPYKAPIKLEGFVPVQPGVDVPGGIARQPGYMAVIKVPVFMGELPFIGKQHVIVPMRYFAVARSLL
jgi:hypothetical protein